MKILKLASILIAICIVACNKENASPSQNINPKETPVVAGNPATGGSQQNVSTGKINYDLINNVNNAISIDEKITPNDYLPNIAGKWKLADRLCALCGVNANAAYASIPENDFIILYNDGSFEKKSGETTYNKGTFKLSYEHCGPPEKVLFYKEENTLGAVGSYIHLNSSKDTLSFITCAIDKAYARYEKVKN